MAIAIKSRLYILLLTTLCVTVTSCSSQKKMSENRSQGSKSCPNHLPSEVKKTPLTTETAKNKQSHPNTQTVYESTDDKSDAVESMPTDQATSTSSVTVDLTDKVSESREIAEETVCTGEPTQKTSALDSTQKAIGRRYVKFTHTLDNFLSNNTVESKVNRSYLLLTTQGTDFKGKKAEQDISINAKLDLANTKQRYQIFFDSVLDEQQSIEEKASAVSSGEVAKSEQSTAGLEYRNKANVNQWHKGIKAGVTTSYPFHPFVRYRLAKQWDIFADSQLEIKQDFWYLNGTGWGETTQFDIETQLTPNSYILFSTDIEFEQEDIPLTYSQFVSLYTNLSEKNAINYRIGALGSNRRLNLIDSYLVNIHFIHRLRGDWIFMSVIPEIIIRSENDWDDEPSLTLKFDFFFK